MADDKIAALVLSLRGTLAKANAQLNDLEAALADRPTSRQLGKRALDYFVAHWQRLYPGEQYVITNGAKELANFQRGVSRLGVEDLKARICRHFGSRDPFILNARHSTSAFFARINQLAGPAPAPQRTNSDKGSASVAAFEEVSHASPITDDTRGGGDAPEARTPIARRLAGRHREP